MSRIAFSLLDWEPWKRLIQSISWVDEVLTIAWRHCSMEFRFRLPFVEGLRRMKRNSPTRTKVLEKPMNKREKIDKSAAVTWVRWMFQQSNCKVQWEETQTSVEREEAEKKMQSKSGRSVVVSYVQSWDSLSGQTGMRRGRAFIETRISRVFVSLWASRWIAFCEWNVIDTREEKQKGRDDLAVPENFISCDLVSVDFLNRILFACGLRDVFTRRTRIPLTRSSEERERLRFDPDVNDFLLSPRIDSCLTFFSWDDPPANHKSNRKEFQNSHSSSLRWRFQNLVKVLENRDLRFGLWEKSFAAESEKKRNETM